MIERAISFANSCNELNSPKGEEHRRLRAALNVGFTAAAVRKYRPTFEHVAHWISEQVDNAVDKSEEVDLLPILSGGALRAITDVALGSPIDDLGPEFVERNCLNPFLWPNCLRRHCGVHPKPLLRLMINLPSSAFRALRASKMLSRNIGWRLVREKLGAPEGSYDADIYIARCANTLAFGMLELAQRPELQARLREEIYTTLSTAGSSDQYDNMPLLNAFIKETLRMYPAAALSERVALEDSVIPLATPHHHPLRKNDRCDSGGLDSRWGAKSEEFDPERWLDGRTQLLRRSAHLFGVAICTIVCDLIGKFAVLDF
ncbi:cytochrome P450 [Favolaschia claudopus]|uniref:Cytochrome P450 n=1 Tax=Favolaschia claudopus TaxID=2862362 RepID=A0AAV9Z1P1_9AGAR